MIFFVSSVEFKIIVLSRVEVFSLLFILFLSRDCLKIVLLSII